MHLLDNVIAVIFLSFVLGVIGDTVLRRLPVYDWLSTRYLFANPKTYETLGVLWFRRLLLATPLRMFNQHIRFSKSRDLESLKNIRRHIATAEVSHWVGFAAMMGMTVVAWWYRGSTVGLAYVFFNTIGNLYPCLLQQYNKGRLEQLIAALQKRGGKSGLAKNELLSQAPQ